MKVLIIGLGSIALKHIQALQNLEPGIEFTALRSGKSATQVEGVKNITAYNELKEPQDFVIVSNPTSEHYDTLKSIVSLNCPVFIEKPAVDDLAKGEELKTLFQKNSTLTYVGFSLRFLPCLKFLKENLKDKAGINEVNVYCGSYLPEWRPGVDFRKNYSANIEMGGGVHLDLIHELDYLYWIFGMPLTVTRQLTSQSTLKITSCDYANYSLSYSNFSANVVLNYYRRDAKRTCEIVMEDDTWTVDLLKNQVSSYRKGVLFHSDFDRGLNYEDQMKYFLDCVKQKEKSMNTFEDSLNVLKIVLNENA